ncbi:MULTISPECIES: YqiA/YcfP family alpha/beta fold hydrolase [unclassified Nitratiruptor]|uniref:YqiA/YcfP family alpha/beta fold hydrolase n=1 Tax=unclassified Nitratiruptor TaxID=2624044 RepID=UPI001916624A|nr:MULTISPECIES: YqiA/YcfP family alpha/beta fold hydrolase [unclassified Nitratiruptor]BCD60554.1 hypothetical protein NitYY0810_C1325 [Nitratiruptor sp. YY08-10]BCD64485.1 hypothetical protein NitYY0814_C1332 [Nitratiruptor sp. YY08-14]
MILYIHGFKSCGWGNKSRGLQSYFGDVLAPDLPPSPSKAIHNLEKIIQSNEVDLLVGSSLGGYYATYLAQKYVIKAVLINPSTRPFETLKPYIGWQERFCDEDMFEWKEEYIKELFNYDTNNLKKHLFLVLLQTGDEVLDYRVALKKYANQRRIVEYGGNHRFENIEDYLCMIKRFREGNGSH